MVQVYVLKYSVNIAEIYYIKQFIIEQGNKNNSEEQRH